MVSPERIFRIGVDSTFRDKRPAAFDLKQYRVNELIRCHPKTNRPKPSDGFSGTDNRLDTANATCSLIRFQSCDELTG